MNRSVNIAEVRDHRIIRNKNWSMYQQAFIIQKDCNNEEQYCIKEYDPDNQLIIKIGVAIISINLLLTISNENMFKMWSFFSFQQILLDILL